MRFGQAYHGGPKVLPFFNAWLQSVEEIFLTKLFACPLIIFELGLLMVCNSQAPIGLNYRLSKIGKRSQLLLLCLWIQFYIRVYSVNSPRSVNVFCYAIVRVYEG